MAEVKMTLEEYQDLEDKLSTLARENHNLKQERDAYKKQRDELINDMQNVKRKASLFDEIEGLVSKTKSAEDLGECVLQLLIENKEANHER